MIRFTYLLLLFVSLLLSCRKDNNAAIETTVPMMDKISYSDDVGTIYNTWEYIYTGPENRLARAANSWRIVNSIGNNTIVYTYNQPTVVAKHFGINGQETPGSTFTYNTNEKGQFGTCYYSPRNLGTIQFIYHYNEEGYLQRIEVMNDGVKKHERKNYYTGTRLDSSDFLTVNGTALQKISVNIFTYDASIRNSIGDYEMFGSFVMANTERMQGFGKSQQHALVKEIGWNYIGNTRYKVTDDDYIYTTGINGRIVKRDATLRSYSPSGIPVRTIKRQYDYTYRQ
jgi:hypothetical protein